MLFDEDVQIIIEAGPVVNVSGIDTLSQIGSVNVEYDEIPVYIQTSEYYAPVQSVNGKIGWVTITKEDLGITGNFVYTVGDQNISGTKNFISRPTINGTGVLLSGEIAELPNTIVYITGDQTISGIKNFISRPTVNNIDVLLSGEAYPNNNPYKFISSNPPVNTSPIDILLKYTTGIQTGIKSYVGTFQNINFNEIPFVSASLSYENVNPVSINNINGGNRYLLNISYINQTGFEIIFSNTITDSGVNLNVLAYGKGVTI